MHRLTNGFTRSLFGKNKGLPEFTPVPDGYGRIHVFSGVFMSESDALAYCHGSGAEDDPAPFNRDQPDALIDPTFVEVNQGGDMQQAVDWLQAVLPDKRFDLSGNTLVIVYENAFGGLPYQLISTPMLTFYGSHLIKTRK